MNSLNSVLGYPHFTRKEIPLLALYPNTIQVPNARGKRIRNDGEDELFQLSYFLYLDN